MKIDQKALTLESLLKFRYHKKNMRDVTNLMEIKNKKK